MGPEWPAVDVDINKSMGAWFPVAAAAATGVQAVAYLGLAVRICACFSAIFDDQFGHVLEA